MLLSIWDRISFKNSCGKDSSKYAKPSHFEKQSLCHPLFNMHFPRLDSQCVFGTNGTSVGGWGNDLYV